MERWLSKPRVLIALSIVMLCAALNRRDPLVYGMFLFLVTLGTLGWLLPWASLRRVTVRAAGLGEVREGEPSALTLTIEQRGWWPVFMLDVHTCWEWAGRQIVLHQVVPVLRRGRPQDLGERMRFTCRGHYRLCEVWLGCSFPLGLLDARRAFGRLDAAFLVLPQPSLAVVPIDLPVSHDDRGLQTTRRLGHGTELGALRDYEPGDPVRRVHWRASARVGHLVILQYLQSGSPLLRVVTQIPGADEAGLHASPGEQAVRAAAGLCRQALADDIRVCAYLPDSAAALVRIDEIDRALAAAAPSRTPVHEVLARAADDLQDGDLLVVVISSASHADEIVAMLRALPCPLAQIRVCIAAAPTPQAVAVVDAAPLALALGTAGVAAWPRRH